MADNIPEGWTTSVVRSPSGQRIPVKHPIGATEAEIIGHAKVQFQENPNAHDGAEKYKRAAAENSALGNIAAGYAGMVGAPVMAGVGSSPEKVKEWSDSMKGLNSTTSGAFGTFLGSAAPLAVMSMAPGGQTVLGSAMYGGAYEGAMPVEEGQSRVGNAVKGAALNAAVPAGIATWKTGKAVLEPMTKSGSERIAGRTLERFATNPSSLDNLTSRRTISGTFPTLGEATGDMGVANLVNILRNRDPRQLIAGAERQNNAARIGALDFLSGSDFALDVANRRRKDIGKIAYDRATNAGVDTAMAKALEPQIKVLLDRPIVKDAMEEALKLAKNDDIVINEFGSPQGLKYLKSELEDRALALPKGTNRRRQYELAVSDLDSVMREIVPDIGRADKIYARLSREPNRMEVARELRDKSTSVLRDLDGLETVGASNLAKNMGGKATAVVKEATGLKEKRLEQIFNKQQMAILEDVAATSERQAAAQKSRIPGSPTAKNLIGDQIISSAARPLGVPKALADSVLSQNFLHRPISWVAGTAEDNVTESLLRAAVDPGYATKLVKSGRPTAIELGADSVLRKSLPLTQGLLGGYYLADPSK